MSMLSHPSPFLPLPHPHPPTSFHTSLGYLLNPTPLHTSLGCLAWLVDIRHEAAHTQLPALSLLREASAEALDWLHEYYWAAQELYLQSYNQRATEGLLHFFATMPRLSPEQQSMEVQQCVDHLMKHYPGIRIRLVGLPSIDTLPPSIDTLPPCLARLTACMAAM